MSGDPLLTDARISFHTNDDCKDDDTLVTISVYNNSNQEIATTSATFDHFNEDSDQGPFGMGLSTTALTKFHKSDILDDGSVTVKIKPNGNDRWNFNFTLTLIFDNGESIDRTFNNLSLNVNPPDRGYNSTTQYLSSVKPMSGDPLLTDAYISFHTNDEDKDADTLVTTTVRTNSGQEVTSISNEYGHFKDRSDSAQFPIYLSTTAPTKFHKSDILENGSVTVRIIPKVSDTWRFNFTLTLIFDNGERIERTFNNLSLNEKLKYNSTTQTLYVGTVPILHKTIISLEDPIQPDVPWGQLITLRGQLIDGDYSAGIAGKDITFSGDGLNDPIASQAYTEPDGSFVTSATSTFNVAKGLKIQAHFKGDFTKYESCDSNTIAYNIIKHRVDLQVSTTNDVPWGQPTSFVATLRDIEEQPSDSGGQTIHFTGTGVIGVQDADTASGQAVGHGTAPSDVRAGLTVKAVFSGDEQFMPAESDEVTYDTTKHSTRLEVLARDVPWGSPTALTSFLTDTDNSAVGITGKTIHFTGTGVIGVSDQITDNNGKAVGNGTAPKTVSSNSQVQADFAGDNMYVGTSGVTSYKSLQHQTSLVFSILPNTLDPGNNYSIQGHLLDVTGYPMDPKKVTFTASPPIILPSAITDTRGNFKLVNLVAPNNPGQYTIQSHFSGDELYRRTESPGEILTVR